MTDLLGRLPTALADRDAVEREPGRGGMADMYLARDEKVGRDAAPKGLRPELAATRGADRFLSGIAIAAALSHPTILSLHEGGEAAGHLCDSMPFVDVREHRTGDDEMKGRPAPAPHLLGDVEIGENDARSPATRADR